MYVHMLNLLIAASWLVVKLRVNGPDPGVIRTLQAQLCPQLLLLLKPAASSNSFLAICVLLRVEKKAAGSCFRRLLIGVCVVGVYKAVLAVKTKVKVRSILVMLKNVYGQSWSAV